MSRDPRTQPERGDEIGREFPRTKTVKGYVFRVDSYVFRAVTRSHGGFVFFIHDNGYRTTNRIVTLNEWKRWGAKAEVIEVAQPVPAPQEAEQ